MDTDIKIYARDDKSTAKLKSVENVDIRLAIPFDFNLLPDNVYVELTSYLSVNDIDHLGESGLDDRIDIALVNLRHATVYADNGQEAANHWFPKLPNTIKTIDLCLRKGSVGDLMVKMGRMFPNLEKLPVADAFLPGNVIDALNCVEYVQSLKGRNSKLKHIGYGRIFNQRHAEHIRKVILLCPELKDITLLFTATLDEQFVDIFPKCSSLEKLTLTVENYGAHTNAYLKKLITSLPSLQLLTLNNWTSIEELAQRFLTFCTKRKFKTELTTDYERALLMKEQFQPLVTKLRINQRLDVMSLKSRLKYFTNLRELTTIRGGSIELILALCDKEIALMPFTIPSVHAKISTEDEMNNFIEFSEVRGNQLKSMSITVDGRLASRMMRMLGKVGNFRLDDLTIYINSGRYDISITVEDAKSLYSVSVRRVLKLFGPSNLPILFAEAANEMSNRQCRIHHSMYYTFN